MYSFREKAIVEIWGVVKTDEQSEAPILQCLGLLLSTPPDSIRARQQQMASEDIWRNVRLPLNGITTAQVVGYRKGNFALRQKV
jgi:hypothetical protein